MLADNLVGLSVSVLVVDSFVSQTTLLIKMLLSILCLLQTAAHYSQEDMY